MDDGCVQVKDGHVVQPVQSAQNVSQHGVLSPLSLWTNDDDDRLVADALPSQRLMQFIRFNGYSS